MTQEQLKKYSPYNAKNLTQDDLAEMEHFTKDDLKALAQEYPNTATTSPYLILKDKTKKDRQQIGQPATWKSLYELVKIGQTQFFAVTFKSLYKPGTTPLKSAPVQDLTNADAKKELKDATSKVVPMANTQKAVETKVETEKSAEQIAREEGAGLNDGSDSEDEKGDDEKKDDKPEKPLNKMNLVDLQAKYETVLGEKPEAGSTKAQLVAAIEAKK